MNVFNGHAFIYSVVELCVDATTDDWNPFLRNGRHFPEIYVYT